MVCLAFPLGQALPTCLVYYLLLTPALPATYHPLPFSISPLYFAWFLHMQHYYTAFGSSSAATYLPTTPHFCCLPFLPFLPCLPTPSHDLPGDSAYYLLPHPTLPHMPCLIAVYLVHVPLLPSHCLCIVPTLLPLCPVAYLPSFASGVPHLPFTYYLTSSLPALPTLLPALPALQCHSSAPAAAVLLRLSLRILSALYSQCHHLLPTLQYRIAICVLFHFSHCVFARTFAPYRVLLCRIAAVAARTGVRYFFALRNFL